MVCPKLKYRLTPLFLLLSLHLGAQVLRSTSLEVVGSPGWYRAISLGQEGLVMIVKEDQTRFKVVRMDAQLNKVWDQDLFMDTEKGPAAVRLHGQRLALLFSETSGMYYQLLDFDLRNGEYVRRGFEIRQFFQDNGLVMYADKALLTGTNEKGLAYYVYDFQKDLGQLVQTELPGRIEIQDVQAEDVGLLNLLVVEKTMGYSNEAKKKGEYVKSSKIVEMRLDTAGRIEGRREILPHEGRFPISGVRKGELVSGIYQQPDGQKGMYFAWLRGAKSVPVFHQSFAALAGDLRQGRDKDRFLKDASWLLVPPSAAADEIYMGGVFYTPQFRNVRGLDGRLSQGTVLEGLNFSLARVFTLDTAGTVVADYSIAVNQLLNQLPLSINTAGAVAYISNGKVLIRNHRIGSRPIAYQLTDDSADSSPYVAGYRQTLHWYDNVFLAIGTQNKLEAQQVTTTTGRKKKKRSIPYTQTRKTFFLTSISAGKAE